MPWSKAGSIAPVRAVFFGSMAPEMPESGTEKGVEPRELSLTESGDSHVPLLSADPEKAKEEDTEDEKSRELRLNEDIRVRPNLVSNLCYAFAFFLGLCIAMFIFARDPHMGSTLAEKTPGFLHAAAHEVQRRHGKLEGKLEEN